VTLRILYRTLRVVSFTKIQLLEHVFVEPSKIINTGDSLHILKILVQERLIHIFLLLPFQFLLKMPPVRLRPLQQFCRNVMIYCGYGSDFGNVLVPVPDPHYVKHSFSNKIVQNLAFLLLESALFLKKLAFLILFFAFVFNFMLDPDPNPVRVPLRQKVAVPSVRLRFRFQNTAL
jgi:hypothetical protein